MVGVHRCPRGHSWQPDAVQPDAPIVCPTCGETAAPPPDTARERPAAHVLAVAVADRPPAANAVTQVLAGGTGVAVDDPSFASLGDAPVLLSAADTSRPPGSLPVPVGVPIPDVPGYEIVREVGRGGMGVVYQARQVALNRPVALKMILAGAHAGPTERDRFRREAESVAALQNPHIVQIFEVGEANGHPYLALEFVDGGSLAQHLGADPWPAKAAAELVELLARAMHFAHERGIVHRDLKPGNILLQQSSSSRHVESRNVANPGRGRGRDVTTLRLDDLRPKVTDFGLAKRLDEAEAGAGGPGTRTGAVIGTPSYIAPEQASGKGKDVGPAADVYALGAILYELLTGRPPFRGETPLDTVLQVLHDDPVPPKRLQPKVPRDLDTICLKCLHKNPARRYGSALALADDLRRFLTGEPIKARPLSPWGRLYKWAGRHPALALLGVVSAAAVVAVVGVLSVSYARVQAAYEKESAALRDKAAEAKAAREARDRAERLADENRRARVAADAQAERLRLEADRTRRGAYALQLAQVAALCDRDPGRALGLLEDEARCPSDLRDFAWAYLRRQCDRLERTLDAHKAPLHAVAHAPDGTLAATAGQDGEVRVWDTRTGRTWAVLAGHAGFVHAVAFSPDGTALATAGSDAAVRLWELPREVLDAAGRATARLPFLDKVVRPLTLPPAVTLADAHAGGAHAVAFAPDGRTLATGGSDRAVRLWDLTAWRPGLPDLAAGGGAWAAGGALAAAHEDGRPPQPVAERAVLHGHAGAVLTLAFSEAGRLLASGGADQEVRVWAADGSQLVRRLLRQGAAVWAVAFSPDGKTLATTYNADSPVVRLWDTDTWKDRRLNGHTGAVYALAVSPDGQLLASGGADRKIRLWDLETGSERAVLQGHTGTVRGLAFSSDRRTLVSGGLDRTARVWLAAVRANDAADLRTDPAKDAPLVAAAVSGDGGTLVDADETGRVRAWLLDPAPPGFRGQGPAGRLPALPVPLSLPKSKGRDAGRVRAVAVVGDERGRGQEVLAAVGTTVYVWKLARFGGRPGGPGGIPLALHPVVFRTPHLVYAMAVSPDGQTLATLDHEGLRLWDLGPLRGPPPADRAVPLPVPPPTVAAADAREVAFHPNGRLLAVGVGGGLMVVDVPGRRVVADAPDAHAAKVYAVAFDGDGGQLASADAAGVVKAWRVKPAAGGGYSLTEQAAMLGHTEAVPAVGFSPKGRSVMSAGWDRTVALWDPVTGQERAVLSGHGDRLVAARLTADGSALVTVGRDGSVRRWRAPGAE